MQLQDTNDIIFHPCVIPALENIEGRILEVCYSKRGAELKVRYFFNGEQKVEWLHDFDVTLVPRKE